MSRNNRHLLHKGFTLPDLMVLVAIIGLFSGVAIPNFVYYKASSRVTEAKLQLTHAYTAQSTFFSDFNTYSGCLHYMGYNPSPEKSQRYYVVGFNVNTVIPSQSFQSAVKAGMDYAQCPQKIPAATDGSNYFSAGKSIEVFIADKSHLSHTFFDSVTGKKFTIGAAGVIDVHHELPDSSSLLTINEKKLVTVVRKGF
jgi:type II secretory pathway pseudopilin PulG